MASLNGMNSHLIHSTQPLTTGCVFLAAAMLIIDHLLQELVARFKYKSYL